MFHKIFFKNNLSFRKNRFQFAELDYLQMDYARLLDLMSNSELKVVLKRMGKFEILFRKSVQSTYRISYAPEMHQKEKIKNLYFRPKNSFQGTKSH